MKVLRFLFGIAIILIIAKTCDAQIELKRDHYDRSIYLKADTMTIKEGFAMLDKICKGRTWNRHVIKNDTVYLRFGVTVFKKIYRIEGKKYVRVKEYEL